VEGGNLGELEGMGKGNKEKKGSWGNNKSKMEKKTIEYRIKYFVM
jgi:hypothetical protein